MVINTGTMSVGKWALLPSLVQNPDVGFVSLLQHLDHGNQHMIKMANQHNAHGKALHTQNVRDGMGRKSVSEQQSNLPHVQIFS